MPLLIERLDPTRAIVDSGFAGMTVEQKPETQLEQAWSSAANHNKSKR